MLVGVICCIKKYNSGQPSDCLSDEGGSGHMDPATWSPAPSLCSCRGKQSRRGGEGAACPSKTPPLCCSCSNTTKAGRCPCVRAPLCRRAQLAMTHVMRLLPAMTHSAGLLPAMTHVTRLLPAMTHAMRLLPVRAGQSTPPTSTQVCTHVRAQ